jgi:hypothetical protein
MALLQYEIGIIGAQSVARGLAGIEARFVQHARKLNALTVGTSRASRAASPTAAAAAARRESQQSDREQQRQLTYWRNAHVQSQRARMREEDKRHRAAMRNSEKEARAAQVAQERFRRATFGGLSKSVRSGVGAVGQAGSTLMGLAGGFAAAGAIQDQMDVRRRASVLANQAGTPALKSELARESENVRGFTGSETLGAMSAFMGKTGDLDAARAAIKDIGDLALATDTDFAMLGETAGNAFNVIADAVKDPKKRIEALKKVLAGWAGQGNLGAVELTDLAQFGGRLGGATRKFAGDPADLLLSMGAMSQAAVRAGGASDAAEATTGVARFAADITKRPAQKALASLGVNVFADKGKTKLKDPAEIVATILEKTKGSLPMSEDIVNAESGKVLSGFSTIYTEAEAKKKGSGRAAVLGEFQRYKDAGLTTGAITSQAGSRMEDPDLKFKEAMKQFNTAVGSELLPVLTKLVPEFTKLMPEVTQATRALASFASWFAENPLSGVGAVVLASVTKDLAAAGIGKAVSSVLSSMLLQTRLASAGAVVPTGAAGLAGKVGAAGAAVGGVALAVDQAQSFAAENGGWRGVKGFFGVGTNGWGFEGVNDAMNQQAREERAAAPAVIDTKPLDAAADRQIRAAEAMERAAKALPAATGTLNRGNSPSPVKG